MPDGMRQELEDAGLQHHGGCSEMGCLIQAHEAKGPAAIHGGSMETVKVFNEASSRADQHGTPTLPCRRACQPILEMLGVTFN